MNRKMRKFRKRAKIYISLLVFVIVWCSLSVEVSQALNLTGAGYVLFFSVFFSLGVGIFFSTYLERKIVDNIQEENEDRKNYCFDLKRWGWNSKCCNSYKRD